QSREGCRPTPVPPRRRGPAPGRRPWRHPTCGQSRRERAAGNPRCGGRQSAAPSRSRPGSSPPGSPAPVPARGGPRDRCSRPFLLYSPPLPRRPAVQFGVAGPATGRAVLVPMIRVFKIIVQFSESAEFALDSTGTQFVVGGSDLTRVRGKEHTGVVGANHASGDGAVADPDGDEASNVAPP